MDYNTRKKIIIVGIIIIIIFIISGILTYINKKKEFQKWAEENQYEGIGVIDSTPVEVNETNSYFTVLSCANNYIEYLYEKDADKLFDILSKEYIEKNNITKENIIEKLGGGYEVEQTLRVKKMIQVMENENQIRFFVYALIRNEGNESENETNIISNDEDVYYEVEEKRQPEREFLIEVKLDYPNSTYEIVPNHSRLSDQIDLKKDASVKPNNNNVFETSIIDEETMCIYLFEDYKEKMLYYPEEAYELLNEEYREKRFPTYEEFKEYVDYNKQDIKDNYVSEYNVSTTQDTSKYICQDGKENFYVFNTTAVMNYNIMLDIYTIPLEESVETYEESDSEDKVAMNVEKWIMAANNKDFKYMYSVLNKDFINENNITYEKFRSYVINKFYNKNTIAIGGFETEENGYKYQVRVSNQYNEDQNFILDIFMNLNEENGFDLYFVER